MGQSESTLAAPITPETRLENERRMKISENLAHKLCIQSAEASSLSDFLRRNDCEISDLTLGKGTSGLVIQGEMNSSKKHVAVKLVKCLKPSQISQITKEFNLLKLLSSSEHVMKGIDLLHFQSQYSNILIEVVERCQFNLAQYLKNRQLPLTIPEIQEGVFSLCLQLAQGLSDIHQQNILHLDIKPSNIMLGKDNKWKFIDMGVSVLLNQQDFISASGMTQFYSSPEQYQSSYKIHNNISKPSDIYTLGLVFAEIAGAVLEKESEKVMNMKLGKSAANLQIQGIFSQMNDKLISKMLSYDQSRRPNIETVKISLSALLFDAQYRKQLERQAQQQQQQQSQHQQLMANEMQSKNSFFSQAPKKNSMFNDLNEEQSSPTIYRNSSYIPHNSYQIKDSSLPNPSNQLNDIQRNSQKSPFRNSNYLQDNQSSQISKMFTPSPFKNNQYKTSHLLKGGCNMNTYSPTKKREPDGFENQFVQIS